MNVYLQQWFLSMSITPSDSALQPLTGRLKERGTDPNKQHKPADSGVISASAGAVSLLSLALVVSHTADRRDNETAKK